MPLRIAALSFALIYQISCTTMEQTESNTQVFTADQGQLTIKYGSRNQFAYEFDLTNGRNSGMATGKATIHNGVANSRFDDYENCQVLFQLSQNQIQVTLKRKPETNSCGLGLGVDASGVYKKSD